VYQTVLLSLALSVSAPQLKDPPNPLVGRWVAERVVTGGVDITALNQDMEYTFTAAGHWLGRREGKLVADRCGYVIGPAAELRELTLLADRKQPDGTRLLALYRVSGDTLVLAYGKPNTDRPDRIDPTDRRHTVIFMKRVKDD
jgi:uncharacterized protein (TIGR03067 family)